MVKRRAYGGKTRRLAKRRQMMVRKRPMKITRMIRDNVVLFKRRFLVSSSTTFGSWSTQAYSFTLGALPNYTEITNLFEQFKINAVKLTFIPLADSVDFNQYQESKATSRPYATQPRMYTLVDKDGAPTVSTEAIMLENSAVRIIRQPLKGFNIYINKPCVQVEVGTTLGFSGAMPRASPWLDCDNYGVRHEGCVVGGVTTDGTVSFGFQVIATYYIAAKGVK